MIAQFGDLQILVDGEYFHEDLGRSAGNLQKRIDFGEAGLELLIPVTGAISVGIGGDYQSVVGD